MSNLKISCVVLSYNGGKRILPTLESCKLQNYNYKDLVVADDASTDSGYTVSLIEQWIENNQKHFTDVKFIKNPKNMGIVKNFRNAALHAKGEIIYGQSQGDMCYGPDTLKSLSEEITRQRLYGFEDPYFWLGRYMGYKIENGVFLPVQLYKDLPHQHKLITKNQYKALKINLMKWEIGGAGVVYSAKYFKDDIYPLKEAPRNWEDGPAFLWALIEGHRIGTLPVMLRWYEIGVGISWSKNKQSAITKIISYYNKAKDKLSPNYTNPNLDRQESFVKWLEELKPQDKKMKIIKDDFISYIRLSEKKLRYHEFFILIFTHGKKIIFSKYRKYYAIVRFKMIDFYYLKKINSIPFTNEIINNINNL